MMFNLTGLNGVILFLILFGGITLLSLLGLYIVNKYFHLDERFSNWEGTRFISSFYGIVGALVGVILGMVLVTVWQNYQKETENIYLETTNLFTIYRSSYNLDMEKGQEIRKEIKNIIKNVIEDSWPKMQEGKDGVKVVESAEYLYSHIAHFKPQNSFEESVILLITKNLEKASELRTKRNMRVTQSMVPTTLWVVIYCCIFISIATGFFFRITPIGIHIILTCLHSAMLSVVLFLIISMMYPYRGYTSISPEPFERLLYQTIPLIDKVVSNK